MRKEIGVHEIYKHWTLFRRRELNGKRTIVSIWSFNRNRAPDGRPIKNEAFLCAHKGILKLGANYWDTYSPVVNWMSVRSMLTLIILRELHIKLVDFVLAYNQYDVKTKIFMELPIGFGVEGYHPRE